MARYTFVLPDPDKGWNLWQGNRMSDHGREPGEIAGKRADLIVGIPASLGTTFAVRIPTTDSTLFDDMVVAQIEKRGLGSREKTIFDYEIVNQDGGHETLLSVNVLSGDLPDTLCLKEAAGYTPSAAVWKMPEDGLFLWKEHRRLVLAARRDGRLTHVQALSAAPELSVGSAQEINLSLLSLFADGLIEEKSPLVVAGEYEKDEDVEGFTKTASLPCTFEPKMEIRRRFSPGTRYLPAEITRARARKKAIRIWSFVSVIAILGYTAAGVFIWKDAEFTKKQIATLENQIVTIAPEVERIKAAEARWAALQPAFDLRYFPLVQLNEVTKALPPSGIVVREFKTTGENIRIQGRARDIQFAFTFETDLKANQFFDTYEWNMPRPKVEQNNTAAFDIEAKPISLTDAQ